MRLGLIGYGNIAGTLLRLIAETPEIKLEALTVLGLPEKTDELVQDLEASHGSLGCSFAAVSSAEDLLAAKPDLVVECAGHQAVVTHVPTILKAGVDVVLVSIGAFAHRELEAELRAAAEEGGARIVLPAGAVGGIDLLAALRPAGLTSVTYQGCKPPAAWAGTPAETAVDLDGLTEATVFFSGTARDAAAQYPKNANVAATIALAGLGFDDTKVELIADPAASGNTHEFTAVSGVARTSIRIENLPSPGNIKTSVTTVYSVLRELRNRVAPVAI